MTALAFASSATKRGSRERRTVFIALAAAVVAYVLGTLSARGSPDVALAFAFALASGLVAFLVPSGWAVITVVALPFSDFVADKVGLPYIVGTPVRLLLLIIIAAGFGRHLTARMRPLQAPLMPNARGVSQSILLVAILFATFFGWSALVRSPDPIAVITFGFDVLVLPVLAFWSLSSALPRVKRIRPIIWAATLSLALQVAMGLYEYLTHEGLATLSALEGPRTSFGLTSRIIGVRADGSFLRSEDYALCCAAIAFVLMAYWFNQSRWKLAGFVFGLGAVGCFVSGLRGIFIPFFLISAAMLLRTLGRVWKGLFIGAAALFVASVFLVPKIDFNSYGVYRERVRNTGSIYTRLASYQTAVVIFRQNWIAGVGIGNYEREASKSDNVRFYKGSASVPFTHNSFLAFLADGGLIGGALYVALFWTVLRRQVESGSYAVGAGMPIIVLFLAVGLSLNVAYQPAPVVITLVLAGLTHVMNARAPLEEKRSSARLTGQHGSSKLENSGSAEDVRSEIGKLARQ